MAVTVTVHTSTANPAPINLTQEFPVGSTVFTGQATNISLTLDDANGCHAVVGAQTLSGGGPGFTGIAYRSSDHRLSFAAAGKGLSVQSATPQCNSGTYHGLAVKQFDRISLGGFGNSIVDSSAIISRRRRSAHPDRCPPGRPTLAPCEGGRGSGQAHRTIKARFSPAAGRRRPAVPSQAARRAGRRGRLAGAAAARRPELPVLVSVSFGGGWPASVGRGQNCQ